jgi:hypothetical protein
MLRVVMNSTVPRIREASAMLVGLAPAQAQAISEMLTTLGYFVRLVAHPAAACERIPVVMPLLVIVTSAVLDPERDDMKDRCVAVGAELVWVPPNADEDRANALVRDAAAAALVRRASLAP